MNQAGQSATERAASQTQAQGRTTGTQENYKARGADQARTDRDAADGA